MACQASRIPTIHRASRGAGPQEGRRRGRGGATRLQVADGDEVAGIEGEDEVSLAEPQQGRGSTSGMPVSADPAAAQALLGRSCGSAWVRSAMKSRRWMAGRPPQGAIVAAISFKACSR